MKKKYFLMGNLRSLYVKQYIENVLNQLELEIYMQVPKKDMIELKDFIVTHNIQIIRMYEKDDNFFFKIRFLGWILRSIMNIIVAYKKRPFDFIHIQYVAFRKLVIANFIKSKYTKCYASFWGSDLLRQSKKNLRREEKYLRKYELISADSYILKKAYERIFPNLKVNFEIVQFGVSLIPYIDKYSNNKNECKLFFNFPLKKKVIAVGYNAIKEQQHDKVLDELIKIKNKSEYFLVFQMSYGAKDEIYLSSLFNKIEKSGFEYKIITNFLTMDDLAKFRIATDYFINAQTTDAFSNSFIENLYAKSMIINASWLHYPEIDMLSLHVNEFSDFQDICPLLNKIISSENLDWNKKSVENRTWDLCKKKWIKIYERK